MGRTQAAEGEKEMANQNCDHCGEHATHDGEDFTSSQMEPICRACVAATMEHGHANVHDCAGDCTVTLKRLDGSGTDTFACSEPRPSEGVAS